MKQNKTLKEISILIHSYLNFFKYVKKKVVFRETEVSISINIEDDLVYIISDNDTPHQVVKTVKKVLKRFMQVEKKLRHKHQTTFTEFKYDTEFL